MKPGFIWVAAIAGFAAAGFPVGFGRPFGWLSFPSRVALSAAAAWYSISLVMTALSLARVPWSPWWVMALACLANACFARRFARERPIPIEPAGRWTFVRSSGLVLSALAIAVCVVAVIAGAATSVDLLIFWGPKGQAFAAARAIDVSFLQNPQLEYLHLYYPPLVTNLLALATAAAGQFSWVGATATFPLILTALAVALPSVLRLSTTADRASVVTAVIVCGISLLGNEADIAGNGEMPLLFFETLAMAILIAPAARGPSMQVLAGLLLGGAASTKVEGLPFTVSAIALFLLLRARDVRPWPALVRLAGPAVLSLGVWFLFGARNGVFHGYRGYGEPFVVHPEAFRIVVAGVARSLWLIGYGLPFLAAAALLLARDPGWRPAWLPVGAAIVLTAFFLYTYLHQSDPSEWISWSAARIFSPFVPLLALAAVAPRSPESRA